MEVIILIILLICISILYSSWKAANDMNKDVNKLEKYFTDRDINVNLDKFTIWDFLSQIFKKKIHKNKDGSLDKRYKENR